MKRALTFMMIGAALAGCADKIDGAIYFVSERSGQPIAYRARADGSGEAERVLRVEGGEGPSYPYFASPDGKMIALVASDELVIAEPDGSNARRLAQSNEGFNWYPSFSPDGTRVLFESSRDAFRELYVVTIATGEVVRLTNNREGNFDAAWSPDGKRIAFASSRFGQLDLFVMNADGSNAKRLTDHAGDSIKPAWAPKACKHELAFLSARDGRDNVLVVDATGGPAENITKSEDEVESFAWRPDGCAIAFAARTKNNQSKIRVIDLRTNELVELSGEDDNDANPAWSPDGRMLAFASSIAGKSNVYIMRADGSRRTRITDDPVSAWLPRWLAVEGGQR